MLKITKILCISRRHCGAYHRLRKGKNNSEEKGQVKGTDQQRGSSLKFQSPPSLGGLLGRTQGTAIHQQGCWPGQPSRQPGWAANQGAGAVGWGLCRSPALCSEPPGRSSPWEWLQGDCRRAGQGPWLSEGPAANADSRLLLQLPGWPAKNRSAHKHIPVQAILPSITALSSITQKKKKKVSS